MVLWIARGRFPDWPKVMRDEGGFSEHLDLTYHCLGRTMKERVWVHISNLYVAHLELVQCYMSIISQLHWGEEKRVWG